MFNSHHKFLRLDAIAQLCFTESESTVRLSNLCKDTQLLARLRKDFQKEKCLLEFPGGPVVKNPPCDAEASGLISAWGTRILHAEGATKAVCQDYRACTHRCLRATTESPCTAMKEPTCHS